MGKHPNLGGEKRVARGSVDPEPTRSSESLGDISMDSPYSALIEAIRLLNRRAPLGPTAWVSAFNTDPIAWLLDTIQQPVLMYGPDEDLLFRNHAAELEGWGSKDADLNYATPGCSRMASRRVRFRIDDKEYTLEVFVRIQEK